MLYLSQEMPTLPLWSITVGLDREENWGLGIGHLPASLHRPVWPWSQPPLPPSPDSTSAHLGPRVELWRASLGGTTSKFFQVRECLLNRFAFLLKTAREDHLRHVWPALHVSKSHHSGVHITREDRPDVSEETRQALKWVRNGSNGPRGGSYYNSQE